MSGHSSSLGTSRTRWPPICGMMKYIVHARTERRSIEWRRYIGKEMLPRNTRYGCEKIVLRKAEKWIARMRKKAPRKGYAQ